MTALAVLATLALQDASEIVKLVDAHCVSCHGDAKAEGDLRLDRLTARWDDYGLLDEIASRVADGEMPPKKAEEPMDGAARSRLLALLKPRLATLEKERLAGRYKKLTAREYSNTLEDLFGRPIGQLKDLPFDSEKDLKKLGEHQVVTSYAVNKYYETAGRYLEGLIVHEPTRILETTFTTENGKDFVGRQYVSREGALAGGGNEPIFEVRNPVTSHAQEGVYELTFHYRTFVVPPGTKRQDLAKDHPPAEPLQKPRIKYFTRAGGEVLNPVERFKSDAQVLCAFDEPIRIRLDRNMKFLQFRGPDNRFKKSPETDPRLTAIEKSALPAAERKKALSKMRHTIKQETARKPSIFMIITGATFRGPIDKPEPPAHARIFGDLKRTDSIEKGLPVLRKLIPRLFRRPVDDEVIARYEAMAREAYAESGNLYLAVKVALNAMLCSPHFVFKYEGDRPDLDDAMIASRLSYLLWNSTPDDELLALAARGKLRDPEVRRAQALRLLEDRDRAARFVRNFTRQWLGLRKLGDYTPNEAYMRPEQFSVLKDHLAREPSEFFATLLHENLSALNVIDSGFVVWNGPLASHYHRAGIKVRREQGGDRNAFRKLALLENPDRRRGGLATMSAIMSLTTDGENTQPILRGVWIARHLLGMEIEPPATVPAIEINLENVSRPREILEKHKEDPSCHACHVKFDHLGLAMENYDVLGRWLTHTVHPVLNDKNRFELVKRDPVDAWSETPDGRPLPGVAGVKDHLMEKKDTVMRHLVETLFGYGLGREVRYRDRDVIRGLLKSMEASGYRLRDLLLELIVSPAFARR